MAMPIAETTEETIARLENKAAVKRFNADLARAVEHETECRRVWAAGWNNHECNGDKERIAYADRALEAYKKKFPFKMSDEFESK